VDVNSIAALGRSGLNIESSALALLLGPWMRGKGPLRLRLKSAVEKAILEGLISDGTRLPSERRFAEASGVSRTTIVSAYDLLEEDGLLERKRGSGSIVRTLMARARIAAQRDAGLAGLSSEVILQDTVDIVDLTIAWPDLPNEFLQYLGGLSFAEVHDGQGRSLFAPMGTPALRERIAQRFCDAGIPTTVENIIVTTGTQQGLSLAASLLVRPGEPVAVEQPTYYLALDTFRTLGARLRPFTPGYTDQTLKQEMAAASFRALYCIPTFHGPTGLVMPESARSNLARLAREHNVPILEDCCLEALAFGGSVPRSIAYYDPENVISLGTLSSLFWPGIFVGWVRASRSVVARLGRLKVLSDLGSSVPSQLIAQRVLDSFDDIASFRRRQLYENCESLCRRLTEELPQWTFVKPSGGLCLWVRIPSGDSAVFAQFAARAGVRILPGSAMTLDGSCTEYLRLSFTLAPEIIEAGVKRLACAWNHYERARDHGSDTLGMVI
jgi:DNA-binding transcriptional MocR family regulator